MFTSFTLDGRDFSSEISLSATNNTVYMHLISSSMFAATKGGKTHVNLDLSHADDYSEPVICLLPAVILPSPMRSDSPGGVLLCTEMHQSQDQ